jgi:hypothetical protein
MSIKLNTSQLKAALVAAMRACKRVLIKGEPGIGKTEIVGQAATEAGRRLITMHPSVSDPTDFKGMPFLVDGKADFVPFGDLDAALNAKEPTVLFLDDLGQAMPAVQAAVMQLADRLKGNPNVVLIAATNERQHRANVMGLLEPVKSRFHSIVSLGVQFGPWKEWALDHGIDYRVIGYLEQHQEALLKFEPQQDIANYPCPRTWAAASDILQLDLDPDVRFAMLCGAVGEAAGTGFHAWLKIAEQAPTRDEVISDPEHARIPEQPDALYAVVSSLVVGFEKSEFPAIARYAQRLYAAEYGDMCALLLRDVFRRDQSVMHTPTFRSLATSPIATLILEAVRFNEANGVK